jgi:hypothetical protein
LLWPNKGSTQQAAGCWLQPQRDQPISQDPIRSQKVIAVYTQNTDRGSYRGGGGGGDDYLATSSVLSHNQRSRSVPGSVLDPFYLTPMTQCPLEFLKRQFDLVFMSFVLRPINVFSPERGKNSSNQASE